MFLLETQTRSENIPEFGGDYSAPDIIITNHGDYNFKDYCKAFPDVDICQQATPKNETTSKVKTTSKMNTTTMTPKMKMTQKMKTQKKTTRKMNTNEVKIKNESGKSGDYNFKDHCKDFPDLPSCQQTSIDYKSSKMKTALKKKTNSKMKKKTQKKTIPKVARGRINNKRYRDYNNHEDYCKAFPHMEFCQETVRNMDKTQPQPYEPKPYGTVQETTTQASDPTTTRTTIFTQTTTWAPTTTWAQTTTWTQTTSNTPTITTTPRHPGGGSCNCGRGKSSMSEVTR